MFGGWAASRRGRINLEYLDPAGIDPEDYRNREDEGILFVDHAGETLYREQPAAEAET
jgi:hypothetical protein